MPRFENTLKHILKRTVLTQKGCLEWKGALFKDGYAHFRLNKVDGRGHRLIYSFFNGKIPEKMQVCHKCDNPLCINIKHLFLGTCLQNRKDCLNKNRQARGETGGNSKLTDAIVLEIRKIKANSTKKKWGRRELCKKYGISESTIGKILMKTKNSTWKHLEYP